MIVRLRTLDQRRKAMLPFRFRYCGPRRESGSANGGRPTLMNFASAAGVDQAHVRQETAVCCDPRGYRQGWCCHCQGVMTIMSTKRGRLCSTNLKAEVVCESIAPYEFDGEYDELLCSNSMLMLLIFLGPSTTFSCCSTVSRLASQSSKLAGLVNKNVNKGLFT